MPDIQMRFNKDMLAITSPLAPILQRARFDIDNLALAHLLEEDTLKAAFSVLAASGAQCMATETAGFTPARLAHANLSDRLPELAQAALKIVNSFKPQHLLVELGECGLPLDPSSKTSLLEHRSQYERAARAFEGRVASDAASSETFENSAQLFDAYLLAGFTSITTLKCALMGLAKVSSKPIFASVSVNERGELSSNFGAQEKNVVGATTSAPETLQDAFAVMAEYGASVLGVRTTAPLDSIENMLARAAAPYDLPLLVELEVEGGEDAAARGNLLAKHKLDKLSNYSHPNDMYDAASRLRAAGVQFLRAVGSATPAYSGALAACCESLDVVLK